MRKRRLSKALAMFLAAVLTIPAAVPVAASESTADKEETVYVKTDANGEEKTVIVSDWLKNFSGEAKIKDATDLTDVENVKGNETYKRGKKDSITWNANGKDIYYQGTSDKNLPVSMKVTYYLDGKEISPKKLVGKSGKVKILISDGQNQGTMKGFGDTRDNIPAIIELSQSGVLSLSDAVATMTCNPAALIGNRTANNWWTDKIGHLGVGALANVTVVDMDDKLATYTIVNGEIVSFENRAVRRNCGAGGWISKFGMVRKTGVGELVMFSYQK